MSMSADIAVALVTDAVIVDVPPTLTAAGETTALVVKDGDDGVSVLVAVAVGAVPPAGVTVAMGVGVMVDAGLAGVGVRVGVAVIVVVAAGGGPLAVLRDQT